MTRAVFGRYEIKSELGRGGMATVYHAVDPRFRRDVALKILPREFLHDQTFRARFKREVQSIAALEHPRILPVHDFGEEEGQPFLVMRFMPGGSLTDRIQQGPLPLGEITAIMDCIGAALDFAHGKGIIHRDVKPANVLFDEAGDPYLSDFGIVKVAETTAQLTGSGIVGTPAYMAPEMMERGDLTHLIDIYALGVTLFQMLTGQLPYEAATPMGVLLAHVSKPIPDARDLCPDLPDSIQMIIERAMAKEPAERYQSAGDLAADLRAVVTGGAPALQPPQAVRVPPEPTRPLPPDVRSDAGAGLATEPVAKAITPPDDALQRPAMPEEPIAVAEPLAAEQAAPRRSLPGWVWAVGVLTVALAAVAVAGVIVRGERGMSAPVAEMFAPPTSTPLPQPTELSTRLDDVRADDDPSLGPQDASVIIVEFSDFKCPYCKRFHDETLYELLDQYGDQIRFVYRDFPVVGGEQAALAAECADEQGAFWEYHDELFANQESADSTDDYVGLADQIRGVDAEQFRECLSSGKYNSELLNDVEDARTYGVTGTPTFFINGVRVVGAQPLSAFQVVIDEELGQ